MKTIINGAPGVVDYGVQDLSTRPYGRAPEELPQHLPKYFIYAQKGPTTEELLVGNERLQMYGEETFTERSEYFNHQTLHSNGVNAEGNAAMYVRMVPVDAGPKPTLRVYLDVLPTQVDIYQRNSDGSIKTDVAGDPIITGQAAGHRVKFVVQHLDTHALAETFGAADIVIGDQVDPVTNVQSQRYPIFELEHSFIGKDGNLSGIRLWSINADNQSALPTKLMAREKVYPYMMAVIRKNAATGSAKMVESTFGEQQIMVSFKPEVVDPLTTSRLYFGERAIEDYQSLKDPRYAKQYGEFGRVKVYQENIDLLLAQFQAAEVPFLNDDSDFTADVEDKHLFNFVTGTTSQNVPYHSYIFTDSDDAVRFSQSTNVYAGGGSDGTMSHELHAQLVSEYMKRYANENDELNDIAYHVESHIYDTGFPLETKYDLISFISNRKDTFVVLSPSEYGERVLTAAEEYSVAAALQSRLSLHPESTYFGTPVFRALIQGCVGRIRASQIVNPVPLTYELGVKSARYMGAGNGIWKNGRNFDGFPGSLVEEQYDLSIRWTPDNVRNRNWDVGLNWVTRYDRTSYVFPAIKTVYGDDTSVLTSYLTACAIIQLNKIAHKAHRTFSGISGLTPAQFTKRVNDFVSEQVRGKFDDRFVIRPRAYFTSLDEVRNYSWTLPIDIWAAGMKTVMTTYVVARRIEDYAGE